MFELDKNNDFVKSAFDYLEGGQINPAVDIFRELERNHKILFIPTTTSQKEQFCDEAWIKNHLYPFFDDSQLIIAGNVLNFIEILDFDFREFSVSWRHWGEIMANWCNLKGIEKPLLGKNNSPRWKYYDFYMDWYTVDWIRNYSQWERAFLEVISKKHKVFGDEYENEIRTG